MNKTELIQEAIKRGYNSGKLIQYANTTEVDMLGNGEFDVIKGNLIKYERTFKDDNPHFRRFDTIWTKEKGWVKIIS